MQGPKYDFEYSVHDPHTGDKKEQHEHNDGQHVKGLYSFKEADGTVRVVEYEAGPHGGFNAIVKRLGHAHHPQHYGKEGHGGHEQGDAYSHVGTTHFGYHY